MPGLGRLYNFYSPINRHFALVSNQNNFMQKNAASLCAYSIFNLFIAIFYLTASKSTNSITGSFAKSSAALAINAAAICPCK